MKIRRYYCCDYTDELYHELKQHGVQFEYDQALHWITLYLYDDHPDAERIKRLLPQEMFGEYVFDSFELLHSKWLLMRSKNQKLDNKNIEKTYAFSCAYQRTYKNHSEHFAHHREQVAPFEFAVPIKWGQSHFLSSVFGGFHTLFCDDIAMQIIRNEGLTGLQFESVIAYKKGCCADNIHQLVFTEQLPNEALALDGGFMKKPCPDCGRVQYGYHMLSRLQVKENDLGQFDFYRTDEIFGDGFAEPFLIISNRAFRVLSENHMTKNLVFQPLLLQ